METGAPRFIGRSVARREDRRLLLGRGRFIADIRLPDMLHVAFVRSAVAHARIRSIGIERALAVPGVVAVFTGADINSWLKPIAGMQNRPPKAWRDAVEHEMNVPDQPILAAGKVCHVGEALAVVVAADRYVAEDAAALIEPQLEPLPPVGSIDAALSPAAALVHEALSSNVIARLRMRKGDAAAVFASGARTLRHRFDNHRYAAMPIECRGVVAQYDAVGDALTVWSATQVVHWVRREVAARLDLPEARVRCIAPDVGGGFGVKGHVYPEDVLIPYLARRLERPVKWIEDRHEHILNAAHARDDRHDVEIGFDDEGHILAIRDHLLKDSGAYMPVGVGTPVNTAVHLLGPYHVPNYEASITIVATNKTPNAPYRGAGRPEGAFVMERLMDLVARALGLDPVTVRLRNMIPPENMPYPVGLTYRDGVPIVYDGGDYPAALRQAVAALGGLDAFRREQEQAWRQNRFIGFGLGCYVEGTGAGPFEGATVRIDPTGTIYVATGACSQGQGHETVFAQIAADAWGVTPDQVTVVIADTASIAMGYGTIASRSAVNSSSAIVLASEEVRQKVLAIAGHVLECSTGDLELRDGRVGVRGVPSMSLTLREVAHAARPGWDHGRPAGVAPGLEATAYFEPPTVTWSYAVHAAIVEIDRATGAPLIRKYVVVHDAGVLINPELAEGQVLGGVCQGLGGVLLEEMVYDDEAQLLTGSLADYLMPTAADVPPIEIFHRETPSPRNPLGVKGLGEGGAIAPPVVVVNAVCDALRPAGFEAFATPLRPAALVAAMASAEALRA
ncbi:MAG TPA: xanthine dehydrogenase family protein molybdopterin-binding subunit [Stellaceae bacterium]|nr:xanthine dehydrogenase family protein molybdopterin-binding subunit [Stellaceae bacterium]